jgi:multidrug efflux pump subunit AcrB
VILALFAGSMLLFKKVGTEFFPESDESQFSIVYKTPIGTRVEKTEATIEAAKTRLKPILMTTIATIVGLIPMALGIGEGSETNLPLARAVIGGLTVSTSFTLFLVPALYTALERFARRSEVEE